jgi:predicted phosphodiesterase
MMERIAIVSDVHGNMTAFEAVLDDIDRRGIRRIFNLGDLFGKGPNGSAAIAVTRERCEGTVIGNWDMAVDVAPARRHGALGWWLDELAPGDAEWIRALPFSIDLELAGTPVRLFHASSDSVHHRIYPNPGDVEFHAMFANTDATGDALEPEVVVYGDIHYAYVTTRGGLTLVNAGSVGNPLDEPTASYAVIEAGGGSVTQEIVRVGYDIEREIAVARMRGMPELQPYAVELRTSRYRGLQGTTGS